ncbi:MAG: CDP-alcohol phosphatidyltransferase family protein [Candidatus Saccharimonas sp.]
MTTWKETVPLVAAYQQTKGAWQEFDSSQRRAAVLASLATFGRLGLRIAAECGQDSGRLSRTQATIAHIALDFADTVDGRIARAGNAVTDWGKVADPLADKVDFAIQDIARVRRGELSGAEAAVRIARDVTSTGLRHYESLHPSEQGAHTAASWWGKSSTITRSIANRVGDVMPNSPITPVVQHVATAGLVTSLANNLHVFRKNHNS